MSDDVRWEDPRPLVVDVEKPVLLRHATALAAIVFWPGLILLVLVMVFDQSSFWTALVMWVIALVVVFAVRWMAANRYNAAKVRQFVYLRTVENARMPLGQTTEYGSGIVFAADDARIRLSEINSLVESTGAAVAKADRPVEKVKSATEHRQEAEAAERQARRISIPATSTDATKERCAQLWLDAAVSYRLAGDIDKARNAGRQASKVNPYILPEEPETPAS